MIRLLVLLIVLWLRWVFRGRPCLRLVIHARLKNLTQEHLQGTLTPQVHAHAGRTPDIPADKKQRV